jgi:hypothetical protein
VQTSVFVFVIIFQPRKIGCSVLYENSVSNGATIIALIELYCAEGIHDCNVLVQISSYNLIALAGKFSKVEKESKTDFYDFVKTLDATENSGVVS